MFRPALAVLLTLATPAAAATSPAAADGDAGCRPEALQQRYNDGYVQGVEDIKAQLARATAQTQAIVQQQLNDQLSALQKQRDAELESQIRTANEQALKDAIAVPMPPALKGTAAAPVPVPAQPAQPQAQGGLPVNPADLAPGSTLTIRNADQLPPELYTALLAYLKS